jgi:hypothetical protein
MLPLESTMNIMSDGAWQIVLLLVWDKIIFIKVKVMKIVFRIFYIEYLKDKLLLN